MDPLIALVELSGYFTRGEARQLGYDDRAVERAVRGGAWTRIRRGFFTFSHVWDGLDDVQRHLVRAHAVQRSLGDKVALSGVSGCLEHGLEVWGVDLSRVHVTRLDGAAGRIEGDVVHHEGFCLGSDVMPTDHGTVLTPQRCALETGAQAGGGEVGLVLLDSLLRSGVADADVLERQFRLMQHWPRMRSMHIPVRMADGRSGSVGESRGMWMFRVHHIPMPEVQYEVRDADGELIGTSDWAWLEHGLLGEFDGRQKYGRLLLPGQSAGDAVFAEKRREDLMREATSMGMVRFIWSDYDRPRVAVARLRRALKLAG